MDELRHAEFVETLFHEALQHDAGARANFLANACGARVAVLANVASLLAAYESDSDFLECPPLGVSALDVAGRVFEEKAEATALPSVPGYALVKEIGRGGMGAVYEAFRTNGDSPHRVAIKLVKRGMDADFILRRFERERRILAALEHHYIARLLEGAATNDGLPYFVMEYVEGQPIDQYVAEAALPIVGRLEVFLKVCDGVSYAHHHRVIHRDLKPSNILVTEGGAPKLLDFGIAKLLDQDLDGRHGDVTPTIHRLMTPEYASPEQLKGLPPTETSDVYSLGVVLYILLTGETPYRFRGRAPEEILRCIAAEPVRKPSDCLRHGSGGIESGKLRHELKGDLDKIVLKALHREPERRYISVEQLAEDIRRYIAGQPVTARGDSLVYRARRVVARHRVHAISIATVGVLCLLLGLVLGFSGARVKPRTSIAVMPFAGGAQGSYSEQLAEGLTDGLIDQLSGLPQVAVPSRNSVFSLKGRQLDTKTMGRSLGVETLVQGDIELADGRLRVKVEMLDAGSGQAFWRKTYDGRPSDLLALQRQIISDVTQRMGVTQSTDQLDQLASRQTANDEAYRLYLMGRYFFNKRTTEGFQKGIQYFSRATEKDPAYALAYAGLADCYGLLGAYMQLPADEAFNKARAAANKALEIDQKVAEAHTSLALVHWLYDWDWAEADREFRRAIELKPGYVTAHHWRGLFLGEMGRFEEAEAEIKRALVLDPVFAPIHGDYARILFWARRYSEAFEMYQKVAEMGNDFGSLQIEAKQCYDQMGRLAEWEALQNKSGGLDAEERKAFRAQGLRGYWSLWYRRMKVQALGNIDCAEIAARAGDRDKALQCLENAFRTRDDHRLTQLKVNPTLDPLRSDQRFDSLLRRMNLGN